ncbi:MAG: biotin/lipoyl-containing protein [Saprospiraceae bacterium]
MMQFEIEHLSHKFSESEIEGLFRFLERQDNAITFMYEDKVYKGLIKSTNLETKTYCINIDGLDIKVKLKSELDQLIDSMGFSNVAKVSTKEVKSPMPGLVVKIFVIVGQEVEAGENLLSLEAMKMENIIKSNGAGKIKQISVANGQSVNKGQVLITFE